MSYTNNLMFFSDCLDQIVLKPEPKASRCWSQNLLLIPGAGAWNMSADSTALLRRGLAGVIIALWRTLLNNGEVVMRTSHLLPPNWRHRATLLPARMKANENFSEASVEQFYAVRINRMMSPSDAVYLCRPCNSLFEFEVVHRYVLIGVWYCLK